MPYRTTRDHTLISHDANLCVEAAQIRQLFAQARIGMYAAIIASMALTAVLWNVVDRSVLLGWLGVFLIIQVFRQALLVRFQQARLADDQLRGRRDLFLAGSFLTALMWGAAALFLFPSHSLTYQVILGAFLAGIAASAVVAHSPVKECYITSVLLILVPLSARLISEGEALTTGLALLTVVYIAALLGAGRAINLVITESIRLRVENSKLLLNVEKAREELEERVSRRTHELEAANQLLKDEIARRSAAEEAMRESENKFQRLFELSYDAHMLQDERGFLDCNDACARMLGLSNRETLLSGRPEDFSPEFQPCGRPSAEKASAMMQIAFDQGSHRFEWLCVRTDGAHIHLDILLSRIMLSGKPVLHAMARDITDRKKAESTSEENRRRLRAIVNHLPEMLWMKDLQGRFLLVNQTFATSCGRAVAEDVVGATDFDIWPADLARLYTSDDAAVIESGTPRQVEEPIQDRGEMRWFETFKAPLFDGEGAPVGTIGSARDITPRKIAEEALKTSEKKYRTILETIADGYHEVDLKGNLTLTNDWLCHILGYTRRELAGRNYRDLMDAPSAHEVFRAYHEVYRSGIPNPGFSFQVIRKDGTIRDASVSIALLREPEGKPVGFHGTFRDITEIRRLEEQLRQAAKMEAIGRLAGGIAHDFNNLMTALMGYAAMLRVDMPGTTNVGTKLDQIHHVAERATHLTKQLLAFSRKQVLEVTIFNVGDLVRDIEGILRRLIGEDIELISDLRHAVGNVKADKSQLEQVIVNLAVNARDAMPRGGSLTIEADEAILDEAYCKSRPEVQPGEYVAISVSDTGCGMEAETISRIFDPFFTTKAKGVGTGLGLSTVYGIIKQHGGHVAVYSEADNGSTFRIYLPRVDEPVSPVLPKAQVGTGLGGDETILLVEDEDTVRELAVEALEMFGYTLLHASTPVKAIQLSNEYPGRIHLLLTDVILPQMDGKALYETLAGQRKDMEALYVSGYTENFIVHRGILHPSVNFLPKPFSVDSLARKVREVLDRAATDQ